MTWQRFHSTLNAKTCCALLQVLVFATLTTGQSAETPDGFQVGQDVMQLVDGGRTGLGWKHDLGASLLGLSLAGQAASVSPVQGDIGDIVWTNCTGNHTLPGAECGYAIVPLDYFNTSAGVAKIALGRYNATGSNKQGSVFVNPGGPGGPGVSLATSAGDMMQKLIGEQYDIIGFDPRGIGQTEPATKCFPSPDARTAFIANTVLDRAYDVTPNVSDPFNRFHLIDTQRDADALYKTQFAICGQTMGDELRYMGTSTVVRDIDYINTLLEGNNSLINFYGFSYGTIMGQYLVNIFPDRVGRVVIDGVVDANAWANEPAYTWLRTWMNSTDDAYRIFFDGCAKAGPKECALAKADNENPSDILGRVEAFIDKLYDEPLPGPNATIPGILTNGRARLYWLKALEVPKIWPTTAQGFDQAMNGDASAVLDSLNERDLLDLERSAVSCNDNKPFAPPTPQQVVDEGLFVLEHVSRFYFSTTISEPDSGCQFWPVTPPERYLGPWNKTLQNPILIVSNTNDPATPLLCGELVHEYLSGSSALLIQDSPGHTSLAQPSTCTISATRAFFANGTLPAEGTVCPVDQNPFAPSSEMGAGAKALLAEDDQFKGWDRISAIVLGA